MTETLYATFNDAGMAEKAVGALLDHGGSNEDISVISKEPCANHVHSTRVDDNNERSEERANAVAGRPYVNGDKTDADGQYTDADKRRDGRTMKDSDHAEKSGKTGLSTTTAGDAEAGAAKGAGIGLGVGVAAAIVSLIVPGFGLVMGGGALAVALAGTAGATAAGAAAGGVTGYLKDQGVPDAAATDYQHAYENGSAVLSIHVPSGKLSPAEARGILSKYDARYVNTYEH